MSAFLEMGEELGRRRVGFSLPRAFYTDANYHRLDLEHLFYRTWLFAGHECELPSRGHYLTLQVGDYPLVVVRGNDGEIRAFHNTCRHRGSVVCTEAKGKALRLVCPYHQWSYGLDGKLMRGRRMGEDFDPAPYGLKPVHARTVGGLIFVSVAEDAPDFGPFQALAEPYLGAHRLADAKVAFEETIVEHGNWKLVWENNRECYHCASNHPELCRTFPETPTITGVDELADPTVLTHWRRCEDAGLPSRFRLSTDGEHRLVRMPLIGDAVSYTMSGAAAVARPLAELGADRVGTLMLFHFPSIWLHVLADHACTFQVLPLGPQETQLTTRWLVHKDAVEGVDYTVEELTRVWRATNAQDRRVVQDNQRGINSPAYEPGPYAPEDEAGVEQFVAWYCAAMRRSLPMVAPGELRVA
ncbi:MAG: aromatic ring-hydroxylating dioxygenase subunit alpha [Geminicoccaceae bacterium]